MGVTCVAWSALELVRVVVAILLTPFFPRFCGGVLAIARAVSANNRQHVVARKHAWRCAFTPALTITTRASIVDAKLRAAAYWETRIVPACNFEFLLSNFYFSRRG